MRRRNSWRSLLAGLLLVLTSTWALADSGVLSTTYYNIHYDQWQSVASSLTQYLDAAFTTPRDVLGYSNGSYGKIDLYFYSDPKSSVLGYTTPGSNSIYINLTHGSATNDSYLRDYGEDVAHETGHVLFFHDTGVNNRNSLGSSEGSSYTWFTEALSYYIGEVAYPYGPQMSKSSLGSLLSSSSSNGSKKASWWSSGDDYKNGSYTSLDLAQLETIGYFLASRGGNSNIQSALSYLSKGDTVESALKKAYGEDTGQSGTSSGADVKTLYSDYLNYYLGHY